MPLPIGSRLESETGTFTWQPGVGFVGAYDFAFIADAGGIRSRQDVRIVLNAKTSNRVGPQVVIDTPGPQQQVGQPFLVAGWAIDLDDDVSSGVGTVHVWAYPITGEPPIFVGAASLGGERSDVASLFGERYARSGYGLMARGLPPGEYDLAVFAWSTVRMAFAPAAMTRIVVR